MKKFGPLLLLTLMVSACSPDPCEITTRFLNALQDKQYDKAEQLASPQLREQIAIIRQDHAALFNGQDWKYTDIKVIGTAVSYKLILNDGTQIWQLARIKDHQIEAIENKKIVYSPIVIKIREYWEHNTQPLIAPLDIVNISTKNLESHIGQFIMISGYLCAFEGKYKTVMMSMGTEDRMPLLSVSVTGPAADSAKKEHAAYSRIDSMVKSPLGNVFTAIGILKKAGGHFSIAINNSQNIIIGQVARLEKENDISGTYEETEGCKIVSVITKNGNGYQYKLTTPEHEYKGKATHNDTVGIIFEGIPYSEFEGDKKPVGIGGELSGDTINMQNYGNSMNYYVVLGDCSEKYISLVKTKKQTGSH